MHSKKAHIIVCGGKTEHPQETVDSFILSVFSELGITDCEIVSGGCKGADISGEKFAETHGFEVVRFLTDWKTYGRAAGIRRNAEMVNYISQFEHSPCYRVLERREQGNEIHDRAGEEEWHHRFYPLLCEQVQKSVLILFVHSLLTNSAVGRVIINTAKAKRRRNGYNLHICSKFCAIHGV